MTGKEKEAYANMLVETKKKLANPIENDVFNRLKAAAQRRDTGNLQLAQLRAAVEQAKGEVGSCVEILAGAEERRLAEKKALTEVSQSKLKKKTARKKRRK